ncbi:MAG: ATP-binding protein [Acidobacteria bacterium]|nr:ATP-binding protein [Acidobacteriota bacterium]
MEVRRIEALPIRSSDDVVRVRRQAHNWASELGFSPVDLTKLVTAASEIARNTLEHGGGGSARVEEVRRGVRVGVRLTFEDQGPGIADIAQAMRDGFSTRRGMGLGLGGAKRLVDEFEIASQAGAGTKITMTRWK